MPVPTPVTPPSPLTPGAVPARVFLAITDTLNDWHLWVAPMLFVGMGVVSGIVFEKLLIGGIRQILNHTSLELNARIAALLRGVILGLFTLWGIHTATFSMGFLPGDTLEAVRKLTFILGTVLMVRLLAQVSVVLVRFYLNHAEGMGALPNTSIFENIVRGLVFLIGGLMLLQTLGISVVPILTALGVGGLAISLALQDTLANLFAGINMLMARQIKIGDYIKLDGVNYEGRVQDIGWRTTVVRHVNNNVIIVPNNKMASAIITNMALPEINATVDLRVAFGSDLQRVEEVTLAAARDAMAATSGALKEFPPLLRFHDFGDAGIQFSVSMRIQPLADPLLLKHAFITRLQPLYQAAGIDIPYPQQVVHYATAPNTGEASQAAS